MMPSNPVDTDEQLADLLDQYLTALHAGDDAGRIALRERNPQLGDFAGHFEALDRLAKASGVEPMATDGDLPAAPDQGGAVPIESGASTDRLAETIVRDAAGARNRDDSNVRPAQRFFGKYELLAETGRGGMGVVYKAMQTDLRRVVALKMILASRLASADDVRRFQLEARAAGGLRHPHIVAIHEVGQWHGQHYFTMDFVPGGNLASLLAHGPLAPETAARLLIQIARAVDFLHSQGIVHRDLKPSNILLDDRQQPYVSDFGLAKSFHAEDQRTATGTILGTPCYMAPEQARGDTAAIHHRSDVYSLGAILYEMLTGRPVFQDENPFNVCLQVLESEPTLPRHLNRMVPRALERVCLACLAKDPAGRYPTAAALADDLERFLRGEPVEVPDTSLAQLLRRWGRRRPALVSHLCGLLAVMLIVQVKYMISGHDLPFHLRVMGLLTLWTAASIIFQVLLNRTRTAVVARSMWAAVDVGFLTVTLAIADEPLGPLLIGYPLLLVAAGLWFSVKLVATTTVVAIASYCLLVTLRSPDEFGPPHYRTIFAVILGVVGYIVGYQVYRLRSLSRYFEDA